MKIVNPLYDYSFKYLMQNNRMAKKVLSVLLECEILELVIEQQEIVAVDESRGLKLYRLDFSAIIINEKGEKQKILIELQKSKLPTNTLRFSPDSYRDYLGENYLKKETFTNNLGKEESRVYPIISIYLLGYNVVDIPYLSINIDNKITNTVTKKEVQVTSDFIDLLTHKTRIIQIRRLPEKRRSRLEQFLTIFNQSWATSEKYILDLAEIPEEFDDIVKYLGIPVQDENFRNRLKGEEEIDAIFRNQEAELEEARQQAQEAKQQAAKAKQQAEEERHQKEKAIAAKTNMQIQFAKHLLQSGKSIDEIIQITGLERHFIEKLV